MQRDEILRVLAQFRDRRAKEFLKKRILRDAVYV